MSTTDEPRIILDEGDVVATVTKGKGIAATTSSGVLLREKGLKPRVYLPKADVSARLSPSDKTTHCPYKGDARYFHVEVDGETIENGAWVYESPIAEVSRIAGLLSFDDRFETAVG